MMEEKSGNITTRELWARLFQAPAVDAFFQENGDACSLPNFSEYINESKERFSEIKQFYEKKEWGNYAIRVHALKSTSKMIGAEALSELSKEMEEAAKKEDAAHLAKYHEKLLLDYTVACEAIERFCGTSQTEERACILPQHRH